ncbi:hypothetical protein M408DRAFT_24871 [Serendipita vermifera MAFF 305830]|uniref:F-box domain-containing protein n=1 Tax=Serendipita vermifera MAFF 305830 TaxID=933852 RepID=A0A0C2XDK7_SERVB|nr:hypothetical protein M408DRAFT_24871 [Serendipita vermifera MAFF 305830]
MPLPKLTDSTKWSADSLKLPLKPRRKPCVINRLPDEILGIIFTFTFNLASVPISLFLVSRHWNEVASGVSLLRSVISFGEPETRAEIEMGEYEKPIFCTTFDQISQAINRIGNAEFELILYDIPDLVQEAYSLSTRCRSLDISINPAADIAPCSLPRMDALRKLSISHSADPVEPPLDELIPLFAKIEAESPLLASLIVEGCFPSSVLKHHTLLERLTQLKLSVMANTLTSEDSTTLCSRLPNVETFTWELFFPPPEGLTAVPISTKTLSFINVFAIPLQDYKNVVSLEVSYYGIVEPDTPSSILLQFPVLQKLRISGTWYQLPLIRAPVLQRLVLGPTKQGATAIERLLASIQLKPKVVYLSTDVFDDSLHLLLTGIWSGIQELHILRWSVPGVGLAHDLSGTTRTRPVCPDMWCLTMQLRSSEASDSIIVRNAVQKLRQAVKSRMSNGCTSLTRVRFGWIDESRDEGSDEEEEEKERRVIENPEDPPSGWIDVL